jgi:hypothetical protein
MRLDILNNYFNQVDSLRQSTKRVIVTERETITLDGLCSPYLSHQTIEFTEGFKPLCDCVVFQNDRFTLLAGPSWQKELPPVSGWANFDQIPVNSRLADEIITELFSPLPKSMRPNTKGFVLWGRFSKDYVRKNEEGEFKTFQRPNVVIGETWEDGKNRAHEAEKCAYQAYFPEPKAEAEAEPKAEAEAEPKAELVIE